ncbi:hypothetical protein FRUB_05189 [Fimbriiglobus ruber]|uniref:ASPIC/UnbV domain-containing protein n=1 Tax=Fimbriiglobus ruber TaxID=1908690 RepID=A0A225DFE4_9BACT|nr:hypothetical protein FRUB_05189 [Fimbriiglobus ruber]
MPDGPGWFEDVTAKVGIDFTHDAGSLEKYLTPQSTGSGVAACDLDGDGRPDLLFLTNGGTGSKSTNKLYRQKSDGTFEDVSAGSGLDFAGCNMGVAVGDIDNDGKPDVLITQYTGARLFLNQGGMKFKDVTEEMGIKNPLWGASVAFLDYDRDGWLDLVIVNYVDFDPNWPCRTRAGQPDYCSPKVFRGTASKLFRNVGGKRFEDVSVASRIGEVAGPGFGVAVADFDGDGWPDIFVANDGMPNRLWVNQRNSTFRDEAASRGVASTQMGLAYAGMGVALGDVDNDGLFDLYNTHLVSETNTLWKQNPRGVFKDVTAAAGLTQTRWRATGWGNVLTDFDNDGWLDLAIATGGVERRPPGGTPRTGVAPHWEPYADRNQLLAGVGGGRFKDISVNSPAFCGHFNVARGLIAADLDGDGGVDLVVNAIGEKARVFRNVCPRRGHWLAVRAIEPDRNRDAVGAVVAVTAGGVRRIRLVAPAGSFLSAGPGTAYFGLGEAGSVDGFDVVWPDGTRETFPGGPTDRSLELRKGSGLSK